MYTLWAKKTIMLPSMIDWQSITKLSIFYIASTLKLGNGHYTTQFVVDKSVPAFAL